MSSLKGQLANVEGSVKSMKMAVVVGSVLTVACLAAVFGVTILANEVSKETKVNNGQLVNRNGQMVETATMHQVSMAEAMLAGQVTVGDVVDYPVKGAKISAAVEKVIVLEDGTVFAITADATLVAEPGNEDINIIGGEDSFLKNMEEAKPLAELAGTQQTQVESRKGQWVAIACIAMSILMDIISAAQMAYDAHKGDWQKIAGDIMMMVVMAIPGNSLGACFKLVMGWIRSAIMYFSGGDKSKNGVNPVNPTGKGGKFF